MRNIIKYSSVFFVSVGGFLFLGILFFLVLVLLNVDGELGV